MSDLGRISRTRRLEPLFHGTLPRRSLSGSAQGDSHEIHELLRWLDFSWDRKRHSSDLWSVIGWWMFSSWARFPALLSDTEYLIQFQAPDMHAEIRYYILGQSRDIPFFLLVVFASHNWMSFAPFCSIVRYVSKKSLGYLTVLFQWRERQLK